MKYDFETRVNRNNIGNMKSEWFTPHNVKEAGMVSFSGAEFEFKTAKPVIDAVKAYVENGLFGFTIADDNYLSHVVWWLKEVRNISVKPEWIVPVQGTIFSVATAIRLFTDEGDNVIIPTPGYNRYSQAASRLKRGSVFSPCREINGVPEVDIDNLEQCMADPKSKLLVLCNPNNPTGQIIGEEKLKAVFTLAEKYGVAVISDEIFADEVSDGYHVPMASLLADGANVISVISLGKTFSFTGVNNAIAIIPDPVLRERYITQRNADHFGSIEPAAYAALCGGFTPEGKEWLEELIQVIDSNDRKIIDFFHRVLPQVSIVKPMGTYVLWADFSSLGMSEHQLRNFFLNEALFCCDMGEEYYGKPCQARICTAVPPHELDRSLSVFEDAVNRCLK